MKLSDDYTVDCELEVQVTVNIRVTAEGMNPEWFTVDTDGDISLTSEGLAWFTKEAKDQIDHGPNDYDIVDSDIIAPDEAEFTVFDENSREVEVLDIPLGAFKPF